MKADITRSTFDRKKHIDKVIMQQGRPLLDADFNEQQDIYVYRNETEIRDIVGHNGAPKNEGGFEVGITPDNSAIVLSPGRIYVDGIMCELEQETAVNIAPETIGENYLLLTGPQKGSHTFTKNQWVELSADDKKPQLYKIANVADQRIYLKGDLTRFSDAANPLMRPVKHYSPSVSKRGEDGYYVIFLEVWKQHITALDDPQIQEKALGNVDTCTREKISWNLKTDFLIHPRCDAISFKMNSQSTGLLRAQISRTEITTDRCSPLSDADPFLGNQLYRVEVHEAGNLGKATFKWSRDNGSVLVKVQERNNDSTITVSDLGKDRESLGIKAGQWVEIISDTDENDNVHGQILKIADVDPSSNRITLDGNIGANVIAKIRRWDGIVEATMTDNSWIDLENGLQVQVSEGSYQNGEYWLIPFRSPGNIEWPCGKTDDSPLYQKPHGGIRHFAKLATVKFENRKWSVYEDCRTKFPSLTEISAADISFDNHKCSISGTKTVQDALNFLCNSQIGSCNLIMLPEAGWEQKLEAIKPNQDVSVCFRAGEYPLKSPVVFKDLASVTIFGIGNGSNITVSNNETALKFKNCKKVIVRDISADSKASGRTQKGEHLNGVISIVGSENVDIENVSLECASSDKKDATCITVIDTYDKNASGKEGELNSNVRIKHCNLLIGNQQCGILVVNAKRAIIEDNIVQGKKDLPKNPLELLASSKTLKAVMRKVLVHSTIIDNRQIGNSEYETVTINNIKVNFKTIPSLKEKKWQEIIDKTNTATINSIHQLMEHIYSIVDQIAVNADARRKFGIDDSLIISILKNLLPVGLQGIVVAGNRADDIQIINNSIKGILQGIHLGTEHLAPNNVIDSKSGIILINGNKIETVLSNEEMQARHGIYIGNCYSLIVENNYMNVEREAGKHKKTIEGICVLGYVGRMLVIKHNHLENFTTGISFMPSYISATTKNQWIIESNMMPHASKAVEFTLPKELEGEKKEKFIRNSMNFS